MNTPTTQHIDRQEAVQGLRQLRLEWEEAAGGQDLIYMNGSVALLLDDAITAIGLTEEERNLVFSNNGNHS